MVVVEDAAALKAEIRALDDVLRRAGGLDCERCDGVFLPGERSVRVFKSKLGEDSNNNWASFCSVCEELVHAEEEEAEEEAAKFRAEDQALERAARRWR